MIVFVIEECAKLFFAFYMSNQSLKSVEANRDSAHENVQ